MNSKISPFNRQSITLCVLISGMFLSFVLGTLFVQTLMLWLLGGFAIYTGIRDRKFYFQWYSVFFAGLFLLRWVALWLQPELQFSDVELSLSFILFPLIFSLVKVDEKQWKVIQTVVVIGFAIFLLVVLYNYVIQICCQGLFHESLVSPKSSYRHFLKYPSYMHPSFLAIILCPSIPMCFNLAGNASKNWQQWLWLLFIPLLLFVIFVIGSRIGLLVSIGLIALCGVCFFKKLNVLTKIVSGLAIVAMLILAKNSTINYTADPIREETKEFAIEKIKEQPLLGHGYKTQSAHLNDTVNPTTFSDPGIQALNHFHNTYFDEVFQFGFIGALPLLLLLLFLIGLALKTRNVFLISFLAIYILFFYVETPFNSAKGMMPMMLFLSVVMSVLNEQILSRRKKESLQ